jgi:hypothetical protein
MNKFDVIKNEFMKRSDFFRFLLFNSLMALLITSCYYDNEEYLYPNNGGITGCDTTNVTYSGTVAPILETNNCNNCHNPASPSGGVIVNNYEDLITWVNNGRFLGSINHEPGFSPMPKGGNKLSNCNLLKIQKWIDDGAFNN